MEFYMLFNMVFCSSPEKVDFVIFRSMFSRNVVGLIRQISVVCISAERLCSL